MNDWKSKTFHLADMPYQVQQYIGAGSHASVWLAKAAFYPHDEIVIKIAHDKYGVTAERVQNEIWFLQQMHHEYIPPLIGSGTNNGYVWLAQPLYQKLTLSYIENGKVQQSYPEKVEYDGYQAVAKQIPYLVREQITIGVLKDIAEAIHYIAGTNIVHADISPGNIMEKQTFGLHKHYILIDWGASALIHRYPEKTFGSLHFTAPERLFGDVGIKSDLFSLGIVCFYILTGLVPYTGETGESYYESALKNDGATPSWFFPKINVALDKIIHDLIRCQAYDRPEPDDVVIRVRKLKA